VLHKIGAQQSTEHIPLRRVLSKLLLAAPVVPLVTVVSVATVEGYRQRR
jgi:hypothetical protein